MRWKMSTSCIISASLPSICQKLSKLVDIWESSGKNNFAQFFWDMVWTFLEAVVQLSTRLKYTVILVPKTMSPNVKFGDGEKKDPNRTLSLRLWTYSADIDDALSVNGGWRWRRRLGAPWWRCGNFWQVSADCR